VQIILSLVVATFFWVSGDTLAATLRDILRRLSGETAAAALDVAGARWPVSLTEWWERPSSRPS
jgi:hypothetical protein